MILVDDDTDSDGVLEERTYYVQNWRHDVVALAESDGDLIEQTEYGLYGDAIDLLRADFDKDGDVDLGDAGVFGAQSPTADCSGSGGCTADFDLDGDVDGDDTAIFNAEFGETYKDTVDISLHARAHGRGYAGYVMDAAVLVYHVRHRVCRPDLGKWTKRDPLGYVDGGSLYGYVRGDAVGMTDAMGLCAGCSMELISRMDKIPIQSSLGRGGSAGSDVLGQSIVPGSRPVALPWPSCSQAASQCNAYAIAYARNSALWQSAPPSCQLEMLRDLESCCRGRCGWFNTGNTENDCLRRFGEVGRNCHPGITPGQPSQQMKKDCFTRCYSDALTNPRKCKWQCFACNAVLDSSTWFICMSRCTRHLIPGGRLGQRASFVPCLKACYIGLGYTGLVACPLCAGCVIGHFYQCAIDCGY